MSTLRRLGFKSIFCLGVVATLAVAQPQSVQAQFAYGSGWGGAGYGGFGFGGFGYGYPAYASGAFYPPFPAGPMIPGSAPGWTGPIGGYGYGGVSWDMPGFGPYGGGFDNPYFGLGLSPLAIQTASDEQALIRGSRVQPRPAPVLQKRQTPAPGTTTRGFPPE